ncbi:MULTISPECIES: hypothetical protein [Flavobacterium]|jgi:uncharacterized coiled-coil protein SlyX|uniref:hypothetical protein n=1 Tax=Flavobacterium TaxID=237 RepID=UPI000BB34F32|nr:MULTISPECIES: hypothetical protein [Flavobacterium]MCM0666457.1 hypothetical protein [Flavobacterium tyrosinilyticum]MDY0989800.1 hypothetical protein [Flavobacterium sp. CFBP9031]PBI85746.1 hypothetical protein BSF41_37230 [Flavobacterium sp. ACN2]
MKKIFVIIISVIAVSVIIYFIYGLIISAGSQRMQTIEVAEELKELKKDIENDKIEVIFYEISKIDLEKCKANQEMTIRISEDSITQSKKILDRYINSINKIINKKLKSKECIDSLNIEVFSYYSRERVDSLKSKRYKYTFSIK